MVGKIQFWHRRKILPGDNHAWQIATHLDQAQVIIMLVSTSFFTPEHYGSAEMTRALQLHQEAKVRVIPVILEHCLWKQTFLGALVPLPEGGKPAGRDDKAWNNVGENIGGLATYIQAEQAKKEQDSPANPTTTRGKSRKSARTKAQPLSGAALAVKSPRVTYAPRPKRPKAPLKPEPPNHELLSGVEPEPATAEAKTATPAYDQDYGKLQHEINQIIFDILIWEPAQSPHHIVAEERRAIYHSLQGEQHQCWLGTQLQVPPGISLQDREIEQARDADMTILLVESPAIGEMHEFCNDYDENFLDKTLCFYPEVIKSPSGSWGLDETIFEGFHLHYYQEDDIVHCRVRTKALKWVEARRGCRYRKQRRSGR